jgi:hypothetical protein
MGKRKQAHPGLKHRQMGEVGAIAGSASHDNPLRPPRGPVRPQGEKRGRSGTKRNR